MAERNIHNGSESGQPDEHDPKACNRALVARADGYYRFDGLIQTPVGDALRNFANYVNSEDGEGLITMGVIGCLADALVYWVRLGDATDVCPDYEAYLQVAIFIIAIWNGEGGWWFDDVEFPWRVPSEGDPDEMRLPTIVRKDHHVQFWNHPAFMRETFEYARTPHARKEREKDRNRRQQARRKKYHL